MVREKMPEGGSRLDSTIASDVACETVRVHRIGTVRADLGESPAWSAADDRLYWVDIDAGLIHMTDVDSGATTSVSVGEQLGCVAPAATGGAIVAGVSGLFRVVKGEATFLTAPPDHPPTHRFNDGIVDPAGRFIAGTMRLSALGSEPSGILWRYDGEEGWVRLRTGFRTVNGLAMSPGADRLYVSDSHPDVQSVWVCDYDAVIGRIGAARPFIDFRPLDGRPDGAAVDATGGYWIVAVGAGKLYRFTPAGVLDRTVLLPRQRSTKLAFGGKRLDRAFLTTARDANGEGGELFELDLGVIGQPVPAFCG